MKPSNIRTNFAREPRYTRSNDELIKAIDAAWVRVKGTSEMMDYYKPAVELYKELQLELLRRAKENK